MNIPQETIENVQDRWVTFNNEKDQAAIGRIRSLRGGDSGPARVSGAGCGLEGVTAKKAPSGLAFAKVEEAF